MKNKIYYWNSVLNFGDEVNAWFWQDRFKIAGVKSDTLVTGIGSILSPALPSRPHTVVLGSGAGLAPRPASFVDKPSSFNFYAVRGPVSAKLFDLDESIGCVDPAVMINDIIDGAIPQKREYTGFIPHLSTAVSGEYQKIAEQCGLYYIDPRQTAKTIIKELFKCRQVITEAMHGSIFCDSLRIPWMPISISPYLGPIKWIDWTSSVGLTYDPTYLPVLNDLQLAKLFRAAGKVTTEAAYPNQKPFDIDAKIREVKAAASATNEKAGLSTRIPFTDQASALAIKALEIFSPFSKKELIGNATSKLKNIKDSDFILSEATVLEQKKLDFAARVEQFKIDYADEIIAA